MAPSVSERSRSIWLVASVAALVGAGCGSETTSVAPDATVTVLGGADGLLVATWDAAGRALRTTRTRGGGKAVATVPFGGMVGLYTESGTGATRMAALQAVVDPPDGSTIWLQGPGPAESGRSTYHLVLSSYPAGTENLMIFQCDGFGRVEMAPAPATKTETDIGVVQCEAGAENVLLALAYVDASSGEPTAWALARDLDASPGDHGSITLEDWRTDFSPMTVRFGPEPEPAGVMGYFGIFLPFELTMEEHSWLPLPRLPLPVLTTRHVLGGEHWTTRNAHYPTAPSELDFDPFGVPGVVATFGTASGPVRPKVHWSTPFLAHSVALTALAKNVSYWITAPAAPSGILQAPIPPPEAPNMTVDAGVEWDGDLAVSKEDAASGWAETALFRGTPWSETDVTSVGAWSHPVPARVAPAFGARRAAPRRPPGP
jgi:hypothetical protein